MARRPISVEQARRAVERAEHMSEKAPAPKVFRGKRQLLFEALLSGATIQEAIALSGYSRQAAWRASKDPKFVDALREARAERVRMALEAVRDLVPLAIKRLGDVLNDPTAKTKEVIAAAREVLDRGGMPKTERLEVEGRTEPTGAESLPDDQLDDEIGATQGDLVLLEGGRE